MASFFLKKLSIVLFCAFSFLQAQGQGQNQGFRLSGKAVNVNQQLLRDVRMTLLPSNKSTLTDTAGYFYFSGLPAGEYKLSASLDGFNQAETKVTIGSSNQSVQLTLHARSHQLKEVVVKDNHIQQRRQEESLNVEVVTPEFIQRNLGGSLMKTLERLPGIKTIGIGSGQSKPLIRGLGFNRVVVVDKGVKHEGQQWGADHGLEIDQFAAGEIELIKGAASFIYGSDAIGGAIDVKPPRIPAADVLGGAIELIGKTNNNLYGTSVNLFGRKKQWFFDSRLTYQNYADYRVPTDTVYVYDYAVKLHNKQLRNTAGRETGLHFNTGYVSDHFRSVFYISNSSSKSGFFANAHGLEPRRVDEGMHDRDDRDIQLPRQQVNHFKVINHSEYHLPGHRLEIELGYQRNFRQEFNQYVNHGYMPPVYPDSMKVPVDLEREFDKTVYSANLRDLMALGRHALTVGLNAEYQENTINGWSFLVPSFKQTTAGAFVYDKFKVNEELVLHAALRFDHGRIQMFKYTDWFTSDITTAGGTAPVKITRADNLSRNFNSLVWSIGLNYNRDIFNLKANIGKSFRMPIAKELGANGVNYHYFSYERGDPTLSPEQSYQADLSLGWTKDKWSLQVSPFYNYFPNYIYLNPTADHDRNYGAGNQVFQYAQSSVMRYGGEVQFKYQIMKDFRTELLGEYLYARQLSGDKKGYTLPFSPPASVLVNLTWSPTFNSHLNHTYLSVDYRITAGQDKIVPPEKKTPGYKVINIQTGTRINLYQQPVMISLQAHNLLNTRYLNHTSFYRLIELPEAGRNIILSLKIPFQISR